jgi:hypothetical protein
VQLVPAGRPAGLDQAGRDQFVERAGRDAGRLAEHLGHIRAERGRWQQRQPPEDGPRLVAELPVRQLERGQDAEVARAEQAEPAALVAQPAGQVTQRPAGPDGELVSDDAQRERQPAAEPDDLIARGGLRGHPLRPGHLHQERAGFRIGPDLEPDPDGRAQPFQGVAAGDDHDAAGPGREQRPDLRLAGRVVEQHQGLAVVQQRPVLALALLEVGRAVLVGHAQAHQQLAQRGGRPQRPPGAVAQLHE